MSLARARSRGARLNARFGVNGIQNDSRSLGWRAAAALTLCVIKFIAASAAENIYRSMHPYPTILPETGAAVALHPPCATGQKETSDLVLAMRFFASEVCGTARARTPGPIASRRSF